MKRLILLITFFLSSFTLFANEIDPQIYGYWLNTDSEILLIQTNNTFTRRSKSEILAKGEIIINNNNIKVFRTDINEEYNLDYFLGNQTLVIRKPNSDEAWLFTRVGN